MSAVLDLDRVTKTFGGRRKVRALRGVSMTVEPGQIFGLLGPNGAGKSTLVKILLGIVRPTTCEGTMLGAPVGHKGTLARVGYLPEHVRFPEHLTGIQALHYIGRLLDIPVRERKRRAAELLDHVGLSDRAKSKVGGYSKGMKQRLGIAQALIGNPDLVFLDEPTDGVDPMGRRHIREMLLRMRDEGKTVVVNSHLLGEVESVTDRVGILVSGLVRRFGRIDDLAVGKTGYTVEYEAREGVSPADLIRPLAGDDESALRLASGERVVLSEGQIFVETARAELVQPVVDALRSKQIVVRSLRYMRPSLEDLFVEAVEESSASDIADAEERR